VKKYKEWVTDYWKERFYNENIFTNLWKGPFWGYINVMQTFELTENQ